jgi:hypothetical protein
MYELAVFKPGEDYASERVTLTRSSEVLQTIPVLLERHSECERVEVHHAGALLFSVDCKGNRIG